MRENVKHRCFSVKLFRNKREQNGNEGHWDFQVSLLGDQIKLICQISAHDMANGDR